MLEILELIFEQNFLQINHQQITLIFLLMNPSSELTFFSTDKINVPENCI